jgi:lipoprotein-releasing system permease protein
VRLAPFLASRFLRRRGTPLLRTSAVAALAAVSLGVASLVVVMALMTGYRDALKRGILASGGQLVALFPGSLAGSEAARIQRALVGLEGVAWAGEVAYLPGLLSPRERDAAQAVTVKAATVMPSFVRLPTAPPEGGVTVAIGRRLARMLGVGGGDIVTLQVVVGDALPRSIPVVVGEIFHTGFAEIDEQWVVLSYAALRARLPAVRAGGLEVGLKDPDDAGRLLGPVESICGPTALVTTWRETNRNLFAALRWQKLSLAVVLSLVLGVGAVEVGAALVVLVTEKRRELGVLMALGAQPHLLRRTLLLVGGGLGAAGVVAGIALGAALVALLTALRIPSFPPDIATIYMVERIPLQVQAMDLVVILALGLAEVTLAALIPARRAAARQPVDILRWV